MTATLTEKKRPQSALGVWKVFRHEPLFAGAALCFFAAMLPTALAMALDPRTFQGVNVWLKPLKFEFAIGVYLATLAWFAAWLPRGTTASRWYRLHATLVVAAAVAEIVWIAGAAAFGIASHYNTQQPLLARVYPVMGAIAVLLTSATLVYGLLIWRNADSPLHPVLRLSLGLGLTMTFVLTLITASYLAGQPGHHVGSSVVAPSALPVMGWSRTVGDLRVAHFFAMHAMHVIPALGVLAYWTLPASAGRVAVIVASLLYTAFVAFTLVQAATGRPFLLLGF